MAWWIEMERFRSVGQANEFFAELLKTSKATRELHETIALDVCKAAEMVLKKHMERNEIGPFREEAIIRIGELMKNCLDNEYADASLREPAILSVAVKMAEPMSAFGVSCEELGDRTGIDIKLTVREAVRIFVNYLVKEYAAQPGISTELDSKIPLIWKAMDAHQVGPYELVATNDVAVAKFETDATRLVVKLANKAEEYAGTSAYVSAVETVAKAGYWLNIDPERVQKMLLMG
jgi:hypothetical protein